MKRFSWGKTVALTLGLLVVQSSMAAPAAPAEATGLDTLLAGLAAGVLALGLMRRRMKR
jgi:hypothetical protein